MKFCYTASRIRLGEFDIGGVLYHANYFHLYEEAREALLSAIGSPYPAIVAAGGHLAIAESSQKFLRPVVYGDEIIVEIAVTELRRSSFVFEYTLARAQAPDEVIHVATTRHVYVAVIDGTMKPGAIPEPLRAGLLQYQAVSQ